MLFLILVFWIYWSANVNDPFITTAVVCVLLVIFFIRLNRIIPCRAEFLCFLIPFVFVPFFMIYSSSGIGALPVLFNLSATFYLCRYLSLTRRQVEALSFIFLFFFFYWVIVWPEETNPNNLGIITFTTYMASDAALSKIDRTGIFKLGIIIVCFLFVMRSQSRSALVGLLVYVFLRYVLPPKLWSKKNAYDWICFALTWGSLIFTGIYIWMSMTDLSVKIPFINKSMFTGRQNIWKELWSAFGNFPIIGLGTGYSLSSHSNFNPHNAMLGILTVFGAPTFLTLLFLLQNRLRQIRLCIMKSKTALSFGCALFALLAESFFESAFLWAPVLPIMMFYLSAIFSEQNQYGVAPDRLITVEKGISGGQR